MESPPDNTVISRFLSRFLLWGGVRIHLGLEQLAWAGWSHGRPRGGGNEPCRCQSRLRHTECKRYSASELEAALGGLIKEEARPGVAGARRRQEEPRQRDWKQFHDPGSQ